MTYVGFETYLQLGQRTQGQLERRQVGLHAQLRVFTKSHEPASSTAEQTIRRRCTGHHRCVGHGQTSKKGIVSELHGAKGYEAVYA